jgi:hypothetical protein
MGTRYYSPDVSRQTFSGSSNPIIYFVPSGDGKVGVAANYWFIAHGPAGIDTKSWADNRVIGGAVETCAGAGVDNFHGVCTHRVNLGIKERAVRKIYQPGMTHAKNNDFNDQGFNVTVLYNGYTDALGKIPATVVVAAFNKTLADPAWWGGYKPPCKAFPSAACQ